MVLNTRTRNLIFGVCLLILVDIIWVLSNELTKYLYQDEKYEKPLFCTYFKSSMFIFYLLAFAFLAPWMQDGQSSDSSSALVCDTRRSYSALLDDNNETTPFGGSGSSNNICSLPGGGDGDVEGILNRSEDEDADGQPGTTLRNRQQQSEGQSRLSESIFVPIKDESGMHELSHTCNHSRTEERMEKRDGNSSDSSSDGEVTISKKGKSTRNVRFNRMAEVREMSSLDAPDALLARLSYSASLRIRRQKSHHKTARTALLFAVLWFCANYLYQLALVPGESALVTVLSTTSSLFTLCLAAIFPSTTGDRFTVSKCLAVLFSIGGVLLISWTELNTEDNKIARGIVMALMSAFFYAAYLVLVKRKSDTEEKVNIPLFFGFVGLWVFLLMWPLLLLVNFSHVEPFELPNRKQFLILFLNGLVGTVVSEALWLWGCFLTSSLIGTLAITLQIPLAMLMDVLIRGKTYPLMFYLGSIPVALSIVFVAVLLKFEDSDPVLMLFKMCYRKVFRISCRPQVLRVNSYEDDEQQESLINGEDDDEGTVVVH